MNEAKKQMDYVNQLGGVGFKDMKLHKSQVLRDKQQLQRELQIHKTKARQLHNIDNEKAEEQRYRLGNLRRLRAEYE